jgi:hypothetical protein
MTQLVRRHEDGLALFVEANYRARFRDALADPRRRTKLRARLDHFDRIDARFAASVPTNRQHSRFLSPELKRCGAENDCYVVSSDDDLDGRIVPLGEALTEIVDAGSMFGTFISCTPGRLAYFHGEDLKERFILQRLAA